jgi:hypothetical protein
MAFRAPIGISSFTRLHEERAVYVDKTEAIVTLVDTPAEVSLFTRPRRFGKTLFLSTLETFFQRQDLQGADTSPLFQDLAVWRSDAARAHHQQHPVLSLSLKDVHGTTWPDMLRALSSALEATVARLDGSPLLDGLHRADRARIEDLRAGEASPDRLQSSLQLLTRALHAATGQPVLLLIDEYDTPLQNAWAHGYFEEATPFFRSLFGAALKDNRALWRAVLTGILRVARESLFSGLNNPAVYTVTSPTFADTFGFTQPEVERMAVAAGQADRMGDLEAWYNGYLFGGMQIYNPWSILNYLSTPSRGLQPYWVHSGGTGLIESILERAGLETWRAVERLYSGGTVRSEISDNLAFSELVSDPAFSETSLWSLLLAAGYLKPVHTERIGEIDWYDLAIPNREVRVAWRHLLSYRFQALVPSDQQRQLLRAMLDGDGETFGHLLQELVKRTLSFHDTGGDRPERVWQAFVLGMLVALEPDYEVRSNLEAGWGRADVLVRPRSPGRTGVVMELKRIDEGESVDVAFDAAFRQLADRDYASALRGIAVPIRIIAAVFEGKRVYVRVLGE